MLQDDPIMIANTSEFYVPIKDIMFIADESGSPLNPRGEIHDSVWMQDSLQEAGQKEAVVVLPAHDGLFFMVDGHTRLTAARALGWEEIRAKYPVGYDGSPADIQQESVLMDMLMYNVRRNVPPSKQGKSFIRLINSSFITVERLSMQMGMDVSTVQDYINLAAAPLTIQTRVDNGSMPWTAFKEWRKKSAQVREAIAKSTDEKDFSVRGLRSKAKEIRTGKPVTGSISVIDEVIAANQVNPVVKQFKEAVMAVIANWPSLNAEERDDLSLALFNVNQLMEN